MRADAITRNCLDWLAYGQSSIGTASCNSPGTLIALLKATWRETKIRPKGSESV